MGMTNGSTICAKHEKIESLANDIQSLVDDARDDGVAMERALEDRKEEVEELMDRVKELELENEKLLQEISNLSPFKQ